MNSAITSEPTLPLEGIRIIDLCDARGQACGRFLADLGAEVIMIEPPEGMESRQRHPLQSGKSIHFEALNANKLSVSLDLSDKIDLVHFHHLLKSADVLLDGNRQGFWETFNLDHQQLRKRHPQLLIMSITDFGLTGPYSGYIANEAVHMAMGTMLSRSGRQGREPLLPPGEMALQSASVQAAWVTLLAYWQRRFLGKGDLLDFSINDAIAQILDPGVGATGSASAGRTLVEVAPWGRPVVEFKAGELPSVALMYPIFPCSDGSVRICVLNPRQWTAMVEWLNLAPEHPFRAPKYAKTAVRLMKIDKINRLIAELFADKSRKALLAEGKRRGIPIAPLAQPAELLTDEHFIAREFFTELNIAGKTGKLPSGYLKIDGKRAGIRKSAPKLGEHQAIIGDNCTEKSFAFAPKEESKRRPLQGIRVLDLGVIVAGGELGRLFADQGADVIKLESKAYGDGMRQSFDGNPVSITFAQGSRGKKSFGLNLRSEKGIAIFRELVATSDIVLSNFKPGTTESLGIDYQTLKEINPRVICAESSAMGSTGPAAKTMGYGPLVRASTSLTELWRYPDQADGYGDAVTIYPDHFVARVSAVAILAKLIQREQSGLGGFVDLSQAECIMNALSPEFLRESLEPGSMVAKGNCNEFHAPHSLFQCSGVDQWVAIGVESNEQWQSLCKAMSRSDLAKDPDYVTRIKRLHYRSEIESMVAQWCQGLDPTEITQQCQAHGVPAGNMLRLQEFIDNPHYRARNFFKTLNQPTACRPLETENGPVGFSETLPNPVIVRAPGRAEHTKQIAKNILGYDDSKISNLLSDGVLELGYSAEKGARTQKYKTRAVSIAMKTMLSISKIKGKLG